MLHKENISPILLKGLSNSFLKNPKRDYLQIIASKINLFSG
jgi:hypothetical protein